MKEFKNTHDHSESNAEDIAKYHLGRRYKMIYAPDSADEITNKINVGDERENSSLIYASTLLLSALQHLVEVYDDPAGKQWTTTSKREALDKAREVIKLVLGE